ncbi:GNAT family N-acetyltransferase [Leeuwenhoekiella marinoflava]|uniref:GNAT family N-acetyltransferase n=1 Tax=Leeuwenhoekiella marinoflava TaxID=988 RepID=UPI003002C405
MFTDYTDSLNGKFIHQIENLVEYKEFNFYYIIQNFGAVMSGSTDFYDCWIYEVKERWCVGFWISGNYLLNSKNLTQEDIELINNRIGFHQFKVDGFHFAGDTILIEKLSEINLDFTLEPFKERYFYKLTALKLKTKFTTEVVIVADEDIQEIAIQYQKYFEEEYNGSNNKDLQTLIEKVKSLKFRNLIYVLKEGKNVIGFCTIMSFLSDKPNMIGTIFIDENFRMNGNGKHLLSNVIEKIRNGHNDILLMTTKESFSSNKMVENVGFEKTYEHSDRIKTNASNQAFLRSVQPVPF